VWREMHQIVAAPVPRIAIDRDMCRESQFDCESRASSKAITCDVPGKNEQATFELGDFVRSIGARNDVAIGTEQ